MSYKRFFKSNIRRCFFLCWNKILLTAKFFFAKLANGSPYLIAFSIFIGISFFLSGVLQGIKMREDELQREWQYTSQTLIFELQKLNHVSLDYRFDAETQKILISLIKAQRSLEEISDALWDARWDAQLVIDPSLKKELRDSKENRNKAINNLIEATKRSAESSQSASAHLVTLWDNTVNFYLEHQDSYTHRLNRLKLKRDVISLLQFAVTTIIAILPFMYSLKVQKDFRLEHTLKED